MKQISEQQIKAVMDLAQKYNIGVQDFISLQNLFQQLPVVETKKEEKKEVAK